MPRGPARHRKYEEADHGNDVFDMGNVFDMGDVGGMGGADDVDDLLDDVDDADDAVTRPMVRGSWTYLDSRPFSMPPPPSPWRRPWSRLSRDQLLRPALIAGFLAAAGVGVWSSGWSPWDGAPVAGPSPASPGERLVAGHDMVIAPSRGPVVAGTDAKAPAGKRKIPEGRKGSGAAGAGGGGGKKNAPGRDPARVLPAERALAGAGDIRDEWVERVERAKPVKKPVKPVGRAGRHREGGASTRAGAGPEGTRRTGPGSAGTRTGASAPESGSRRANGGAGHESGRAGGGAGQGTGSAGRGAGSTERGTASTGGDAGSSRTTGRPRSGTRDSGTQNSGAQGSGARGSGTQEGRSQPRAGRAGTPSTRAPSPSASRNRPPATGSGSGGGGGGGGGGAAGISAAYACRHLPPGDWRHAYCVRVWNDYRTRNGLP
ncbi:hypothetical protein [Streptosporangium sp. NPDC002524]|uniref:hypothetical protein n=1 Tax=Streptosporangium sp. NPDC002524 TaxID=3154537 RepID=UPI00331D6FFC